MSGWRPRELALLSLAALGFLARLLVLHWSVGSNDIFTWEAYGHHMRDQGLIWLYENVLIFNHPPLMGYLAQLSFWLSEHLGVRFAVTFKLWAVAAEIAAAWLLFDLWRRRQNRSWALVVLAAFAWNLDGILIGSHHGNTDCIVAVLCLLSAYLVEERQLHFAGGVALAAAINVKLIPVLLVPCFVLRYRRWREVRHFVAGLSLGVLPFIPIFLVAGAAFYRNAVAYRSLVDRWGIHFLLPQASSLYQTWGPKLVVVTSLALAALAARSERFSRYELGAVMLALFLFLAPGFGVQYTVVAVPLLFAVRVGLASGYSLLAGLFCLGVYWHFWDGKIPATSYFTESFPLPAALFGLLAWWTLGGFVGDRLLPRKQLK
jgi:hypothetical protein